MSATARDPEERTTMLLPHQAAFIDTALSSTSKRLVVLRGDVGLGKTVALVVLASRLLRERPRARVLLLCPAALRHHWIEMLHDDRAQALLVDRYKFREMLDASAGGELWPRGVAAVLSDDFAKQPDVRDSLASAHWDLVIADEAHRFTGTRAELLRRVGATADRVVLATLPSMAPPDGFPMESATVVDWRLDQLVDYDGKPLNVVSRPLLHDVPFALSPAERDLSKTVGALCQVLEADTPQQRFGTKVLFRTLCSSPAALENALRRFAAGPKEQDETNELLEDSEEKGSLQPMDPIAVEKARAIAGQALQELEAIQVDSKLDAFGSLLANLTHVETSPRWICVLTDYLSTLYYLAAEIEKRGLACLLLHGGMGHEARQESLRMFANTGGVLVATRAMTEGLSLPDVTDLVLYDLPGSRDAFQKVLGWLDRFGRTKQLTIHALAPSDGADGVLLERHRLLHEIVAEQQGRDEAKGDGQDGQS